MGGGSHSLLRLPLTIMLRIKSLRLTFAVQHVEAPLGARCAGIMLHVGASGSPIAG